MVTFDCVMGRMFFYFFVSYLSIRSTSYDREGGGGVLYVLYLLHRARAGCTGNRLLCCCVRCMGTGAGGDRTYVRCARCQGSSFFRCRSHCLLLLVRLSMNVQVNVRIMRVGVPVTPSDVSLQFFRVL